MIGIESIDTIWLVDRAHRHQFAVKMKHIGTAGTLVEIIDILCDDIHFVVLFESRQPQMPCIGLGFEQFAPPGVVEIMDKTWIASETVGTGHVHHRIVFPQSAAVAEGADTAFGAHACAGGDYEFFHREKVFLHSYVQSLNKEKLTLP